jgi:tetratricopeptide (TPR) repeat protein
MKPDRNRDSEETLSARLRYILLLGPLFSRVTKILLRRWPDMAEYSYCREIARCARQYGAEHRYVMNAHLHHAVALNKLGRHQEAEAEIADVIARWQNTEDVSEIAMMCARAWHVEALTAMGGLADAEEDLRALCEWRSRSLGPRHPDTLDTREAYAVALYNTGRREEAEEEAVDVAWKRLIALGPGHPDASKVWRLRSYMRKGPDHIQLTRPRPRIDGP